LINWLLSPAQNPAYVLGPGAGFPVLKSALAEPAYQAPFYQQAAAAVKASVCRPHYGSLEDPIAANEAVMDVVYRVVKEDPTLDIAAELQKAQDQFNSQLP
jgi:multiple sugar transport system substrate-binding protein